MTVGLKGHVLNPAFPEGYSNWQETDPKTPDRRRAGHRADRQERRQGGQEARQGGRPHRDRDRLRPRGRADRARGPARDARRQPRPGRRRAVDGDEPTVQRARYSALTKDEIERAFDELDELSYPLAYAAQTRGEIDLIWGATLTRAVSLATRRFGSNFLSVGRVQSPTLGLIVERELERRAHVAGALLGGLRQVHPPRGLLRGAPQDRQVLGEARGRGGARRHRLARASVAELTQAQEHAQAADSLQHDRLRHRRLQPPRHHPLAGDADRRGPLHGRVHLLPAHRQHRLPAVAAARRARHLARPDPRVQRRQGPARRAS